MNFNYHLFILISFVVFFIYFISIIIFLKNTFLIICSIWNVKKEGKEEWKWNLEFGRKERKKKKLEWKIKYWNFEFSIIEMKWNEKEREKKEGGRKKVQYDFIYFLSLCKKINDTFFYLLIDYNAPLIFFFHFHHFYWRI